MLTKGILVIILNFHEYTGCIGTFKAQQDKLVLLTMVKCPSGEQFDYIAGIPLHKVEVYGGHSNRDRSGQRRE